MQETKEIKKGNKGITLVALVITIIVLLILAAVGIGAIAGEDGLIAKARQAAEEYNEPAQEEADTVNGLLNMIEQGEEYISTTESYVGYYANLDEDEEPEGIIYADLLIGGSGQWGDADGTYTINTIENAKEYKISEEKYNGAFGEKEVITASGEGSERSDRFHVMALEDIDSSEHYWYYNARGNMGDYATATSKEFGAGRTNTATMIAKWNSSAYGAQNDNDMWGLIQEEVAQGWFVPSRGEWAAFADAFDITDDSSSQNYYKNFGLGNYYWSSSQCSTNGAWGANFGNGFLNLYGVNSNYFVRLATTF